MKPTIDYVVEEKFHDDWASSTNVNEIDVIAANEACTAPEMRYIFNKLGSVKDLSVLDFGCGLGEASCYFAIKGAKVTACDLSQEMLNTTSKLAQKYHTQVATFKAEAHLQFPESFYGQFDIVYVGNLLHHVDIDATLAQLKKLLKPNGVFVSWDPVFYNPMIMVYRIMAKNVRTPDEHPLKIKDLDLFRKHFSVVQFRPFWLFTLVVFILMYLTGSSPGQDRFWKKVITDHKKWAPLYKPLEFIDNLLLVPLGRWLWPLCWNLVIMARQPQGEKKN